MVVDSVHVEFMPAGGEGDVDELQADEIEAIEHSAIASLKVMSLPSVAVRPEGRKLDGAICSVQLLSSPC
jgi:hypothetical protein